MKAVNLIPNDQRSGASVGAGRSEGVAYGLLGLLLVVALMAVLYGKASRQISSQQSQETTLKAEAQQAQSQATSLAPYATFASLREQRAQSVDTLVNSRFDWAHAFHEFGRVLGNKVSISTLDGTIAAAPVVAAAATPAPATSALSSPSTPAASTTPASATASSVTSTTPPGSIPTFTLAGCATSQDAVAQMLQRLRLIDGVAEVSLQSSVRSGTTGAASAAVGSCTAGAPVFSVGITFDPLPAAATAAAAVTKSSAQTVADKSGTTTTTSAPTATSSSSSTTSGAKNE